MRSQAEIQAELDAVTAEDLADEARIVELNAELAEAVAYDAGLGNISAGPVEDAPVSAPIDAAVADAPNVPVEDAATDTSAAAPADDGVNAGSPAADVPGGTGAPVVEADPAETAAAPPVETAAAPETGAGDTPVSETPPVEEPVAATVEEAPVTPVEETPAPITADDVLAMEYNAIKADYALIKSEVLNLAKKAYGEAATIEEGGKCFIIKTGEAVRHIFSFTKG